MLECGVYGGELSAVDLPIKYDSTSGIYALLCRLRELLFVSLC
jgi:hypothetical protein